MICPNCNKEVEDNSTECLYCQFDLSMYKSFFDKLYAQKLAKLDSDTKPEPEPKVIYNNFATNNSVHEVRCPYCNSSNLTRITAVDKAVNIALFGLLGNKRKYQWHCNNCKTNW